MFRMIFSSPDEKEVNDRDKRFYITYKLSFTASGSEKDTAVSALISEAAPLAYSEIRSGIYAMLRLAGMAHIALPLNVEQFT